MLKGTPKDTKARITLLGLSLPGEQLRERTPTLYITKSARDFWDDWVPLNQNVYQKESAQNRCTNSKGRGRGRTCSAHCSKAHFAR